MGEASSGRARPVLIAGLGQRWRGDDAAGLEVVGRLGAVEVPPGIELAILEGEPLGLLDLWEGRIAAVVVDAVAAEAPPGTIVELDAIRSAVPVAPGRTSSHAIGLADTIELGRRLGRLPERLVVLGVVGSEFQLGSPPSPPVAAAIGELTARARRIAASLWISTQRQRA